MLRPKLKQDSIFLPSADGVVFRNGSNVFSLKGKGIYKWVCSLAPHLNGEHTLEELCTGLELNRHEMVKRLVQALLEKGIVKDAVVENASVLPESVRLKFKSQIDFIDHYCERPLSAFTLFRQSKVLLVGEGESFKALALALLRNGLEKLTLAPTSIIPDFGEIESELDSLRKSGVQASLSVLEAKTVDALPNLKQIQAVAYCSDRASLKPIALLNERCRQEGRTFLPGFLFGGQSFVGPLTEPGITGCWFCAVLRLSANLDDLRRGLLWQRLFVNDSLAGDEKSLSLPTARMLGNSMAFELFKILGEHMPPETRRGGVLIQNLHTLEAARAAVIPHPLCPICSVSTSKEDAARLAEIVQRERDSDASLEHIVWQWHQRAEPLFGIIQKFDDNDLPQIPLRATSLLVGHPVGGQAASRLRAFHEETTLQARGAAIAQALGSYAESVVDRRKMLRGSLKEFIEADLNPVKADDLYLSSGINSVQESERTDWVQAFSLLVGGLRLVPAAAVYPLSALNNNSNFKKTTGGAAIGLNFDEVRKAGLTSAMGYESLDDAVCGRGEFVALDLHKLAAADANLAYLAQSIERLNGKAQVYLVVGEWPVHVAIATTQRGSGTPEYVTHIGISLSKFDAVKQLLVGVIGELQVEPFPDETVAAAELLFPEIALPPDLEISLDNLCHYENVTTTIDEVEDFLRRKGVDALFINTTPTDVWETHSFVSGRVLLARQFKN